MKKTVFAALIAAAIAAACAQVSPGGLMKAARLDPLETPPGDISVAVAVPQNIQIRSGDAALYLGYQPEIGQPVDIVVPLSRQEDPLAPMPLRADQVVYVFGFAPDAATALARTQAQIRELKAAGVDGTGTLSIMISGGCYEGELNDTLITSTWLRTGPDASFTQLTRAANLFALLDAAAGANIRSGLAQC